MEKVLLAHPGTGATAEVYLHGAHVTSWRPAPGAEDVLFLSRAARFEPGEAIRGGIPVIFPQFADRGPFVRHGFARTAFWHPLPPELAPPVADGESAVTLRLDDSPPTLALWPHPFRAELTVTLAARRLSVALSVENRDRGAVEFTAALHTYLRVDDVSEAAVAGLAGAAYESRTEGVERAVEPEDAVRVAGELDRIYLDAPGPLAVHGAAAGRTVLVSADDFADVVLWNPGPARARALPDFADGEWRRMLCVEAAAVGRPVRLAPGAAWTGRQTLAV
jgi:glucose-6-phosphate 1-epimerase